MTLVAFFFASGATAQTDVEFDEDDSSAVADTLMPDTFKVAEQALPWNIAVAKHLDNLLEHDMFETSTVGMMVYDLDADSVLYSHNARQLLRPASTMKLVTAIAAIDRLGGSYQFKTELCYTGEVNDRTLTGNIYCVGGFDPRFNSDDMRAFVEAIHKMGVDTIRGNIYADKSMKDADQFGAGWCWDDDNPALSPLLISRKDSFVERFVSDLIADSLVVEANVGESQRPDSAYCICRRFHTIDQILMRMMKNSDNLYAESMFYQLAASTGTRQASAKQARSVINRLISKVGLNPKRYEIADGSGLSLYNYLSAELEVRLLRYAFQNNNIYMHLRPSLPIAGEDGTLRKRMTGVFTAGNVRAKTGTVQGVSSLAGYCTAANGHRLAFSIINQGIQHHSNGRAFQDRVCTVLCQP
ncbi:D-alanyl-D-alanine carboxypeptidase/D-alanyl-D-alanine endopeptidase [Leyella stercorea]|uniref:D-alanyl-D-alanine carboxypeptidase/D-alanyl-D-alanine endopeptidase n=1 Tax=Leyella stercorea TaxID=363265 RepID=UPI00266BCAA8|nr:D-alanyl-D-alanine carboxypeptidase/D-alanyl-D-alanine-endopeptidase [Leyella stercorea]